MVREVDIRWSKEIEFHEINKNMKLVHDYGLYMILETGFKTERPKQYGNSLKELIYIGIIKSSDRNFLIRMQEHRRKWLHNISEGQIFVKFGILYSNENVSEQLIEDAESALVFEHRPSENTSKMSSYTIAKDLIVKNINHGDYVKPTIKTVDHTG